MKQVDIDRILTALLKARSFIIAEWVLSRFSDFEKSAFKGYALISKEKFYDVIETEYLAALQHHSISIATKLGGKDKHVKESLIRSYASSDAAAFAFLYSLFKTSELDQLETYSKAYFKKELGMLKSSIAMDDFTALQMKKLDPGPKAFLLLSSNGEPFENLVSAVAKEQVFRVAIRLELCTEAEIRSYVGIVLLKMRESILGDQN